MSIVAFSNNAMFSRMLFSPYLVKESNQYYRFFTYGLIHADWMHLIVNMFVLNSFGKVVEVLYSQYFPVMGSYYYWLLYIFGLIISVIPAYGKNKENSYYAAVGASGAVSSIVFASIIMNPFQGGIMIFPFPISIPPALFGILYLVFSAYMSKKSKDNVGHDAHFWGAIFGIAFTITLKPALVVNFLNQIIQIL